MVNTIKKQAFERRTDFPLGKIYLSLFREIKVAQYTFRLTDSWEQFERDQFFSTEMHRSASRETAT